MIAVDTNVLVRYLVEDDERQAAAASKAISSATARGEKLFVGQIVLCELAWVLSRAYRRTRTEIADVLEMLTKVAEMEIEQADQVRRAVDSFRRSRGDFADYLIRERSRAAGCSLVLTFDEALLRDDSFVNPH